ncbi:MAG: hypothetical protein U0L79_02735 [Lachnospiraceae bacterium]|nr:hypothetical protein [Lachnospiraceae bacterium]
MRKYILGFISVIIIGSIAGCGGNVESKDKATTKVEETSNETTYLMEEETSLELDGNTSEATIEIVEETTTIVAEQEITTKEDQNETQKKTSKPVETTQKKTAKPANKPAETTTQKATEKQTSKPTVTEAPIVTKVGNVDNATYNKAVSAFEGIVKKMRKDGVVKATDTCVVMEGSTIKIDINYGDKDTDLILSKGSNNIYTLTVDYDFCWISGMATTINGKDSSSYNKELLKAVLSMVSGEVELLYNRIDMDCFSAMGLYSNKWTQIGDCSIKSGEIKVDKYFTYLITKEDVDSRDKTFTLVGKNSAGKTVECILEYDSSVVTYETTDNGAYMEGNAANNIFGYPTIRTGSSTYENYKKTLVDSWKAKGDPNAFVTEISTHSVNGYTYYWFELFYETADAKGDPEVLYVQIGANEYLELYGFESWIRLEDFANDALYIKEIKVK